MALVKKGVTDENNNVDIKKEDKDSEKYKVALKLINLILVNIGNTEIDDLVHFVNVDREDIIKDINKESFSKMETEIFPLFNKMNCGYYRKTGNGFVLNILRGMMKEMSYELFYIRKEIGEHANGKYVRRKHCLYSIK